jgi:proteasome component ECM29
LLVGVPLKIKILGLLSKSTTATTYPQQISKIVEEGLISNYDNNASRATGREASKFRSAIFLLVNFVARHGAKKDIATVAPSLVQNLKSFIEDQGWPTPNRDEDLELRGYAFETIGLLAKAAPESTLIEPSVSLLQWLFRSLREDTSGKDVAVSIEEALSSVLGPFTKPLENTGTSSKFRHLLLKYTLLDHPSKVQTLAGEYTDSHKTFRSTRYVAARFANRCLPYHDVLARWIDILASSGAEKEKHEVVEEGKKGLDPYWYQMLNASPDITAKPVTERGGKDRFSFPDFDELVEYIFDQRHVSEDVEMDEGDSPDTLHRVQGFRIRFMDAFPTAVKYCCQVLMQTSLEEKNVSVEASAEWERKLETTVSTDQRARQAVRAYTSNPQHSVSLATVLRAAFEEVIKDDTTDIGPLGDTFIDLCSLCPDGIWTQAGLVADFRSLEPSVFSNNSARRTATSHGFGLLASHRSCDGKEKLASLSLLLGKMQPWDGAVGADLNKASGATLALAYYFSRLQWRGSTNDESKELLSTYLRTLFDMLKGATDATLKDASHLSIDQLSLFQVLTPSVVSEYMPFTEVVDKIYETARAGKANAILALGHFGMIAKEKAREDVEKSDLQYLEEKLYSLHEVRQSEVQFSVGEAYSCFATGWDSKALAAAVDIEGPSQVREEWDDAIETPRSAERNKTWGIVLEKTLAGCRNTKPSLKKASVIWLLCLLQFCGHRPEIQKNLPACQAAFKLCLSDRDEVVQEAASRGLGLVYEKGDRTLKDELVRDLVGSFSDNRSKMAGSVTADTELFEPGALPTGDKGSITTYKDILSLASEVGDSSLVYRFMSLAANNSIWSSRAAFGRFGLSNIFSDSSVDGYLAENPKLYPKLYRYR